MKKQRLALGLTLALTLTLTPALAAGADEKFPVKQEYPGYTDVPAGAWFEPGAKLCYEIGLMNGSDLGFEPERNMTVAEVAAIAARMGEAITGKAIPFITPMPGQEVAWYQPYLNYLADFGLTDLGDPAAPATRGQFLSMLAAVVPPELLSPINAITALPDSADADVLRFYSAGILTGVDGYGTFAPLNPLTRQEGAAMVSRVAREGLRSAFTPADYAPFTAARCAPGDLFFKGDGKAVTAEAFLTETLTVIGALESACVSAGIDFNWFHTETASGLTFRDYTLQTVLSALGVGKTMATPLYEKFDLQVFYSRYIDLTGVEA